MYRGDVCIVVSLFTSLPALDKCIIIIFITLLSLVFFTFYSFNILTYPLLRSNSSFSILTLLLKFIPHVHDTYQFCVYISVHVCCRAQKICVVYACVLGVLLDICVYVGFIKMLLLGYRCRLSEKGCFNNVQFVFGMKNFRLGSLRLCFRV